MTKKELAEALEEVRQLPEIGERVKQETPEDVSAFWAKVLTEKGYDVSSEEIASFIQEAEEEQRKKTQENAGKIEEVSDQVLEEVAGGYECTQMFKQTHPDCKYTFHDKENCWAEDGCDISFIWYDDYLCAGVHNCVSSQL